MFEERYTDTVSMYTKVFKQTPNQYVWGSSQSEVDLRHKERFNVNLARLFIYTAFREHVRQIKMHKVESTEQIQDIETHLKTFYSSYSKENPVKFRTNFGSPNIIGPLIQAMEFNQDLRDKVGTGSDSGAENYSPSIESHLWRKYYPGYDFDQASSSEDVQMLEPFCEGGLKFCQSDILSASTPSLKAATTYLYPSHFQ